MAKQNALHKEEDTLRLEGKLRRESKVTLQSLPLPLTSHISAFERLAETLADEDPHKRGTMLDRLYHAGIGQITTGFAPAAVTLAYMDWIAHISVSPFRQLDLLQDAQQRAVDLWASSWCYALGEPAACRPHDTRFQQRYRHESWQRWPYNMLAQAHLSAENWWQEASHVKGMTPHHQNMLKFLRMLALSACSPENFPLLNPEIQEKTFAEGGMNYLKGLSNALDDARHWLKNDPLGGTEGFVPGKDVALTEGKVIFRNALFELIQYEPTTPKTYPEPILIIPAWIMKYYILDLSPRNSMVKYMVGQGHTVFMMSWKNPDARYRDVNFTDYLKEGALQALDAVREVIPGRRVHAVGYCIGGTLLSMLAAYLANKRQDRLQTVTLFAAQTDFTEAGGLMTFIDDAQLDYLEDVMFTQGYLRGDQISAAFELLQPRELIWHRMIQDYWMGERTGGFDLMAWDKDTTRLPYQMHSQYLRHLYLHNCLAGGELEVDGETLDLDLITTPMFVVSTEKDHIAPWKSVYKIHHMTDAEITFVLTNKGHNGGIVSEVGHPGREFRIATRKEGERTVQPAKWIKRHEPVPGSWWENWHAWLKARSGALEALPGIGAAKQGYAPIADAPGQYVHEH